MLLTGAIPGTDAEWSQATRAAEAVARKIDALPPDKKPAKWGERSMLEALQKNIADYTAIRDAYKAQPEPVQAVPSAAQGKNKP